MKRHSLYIAMLFLASLTSCGWVDDIGQAESTGRLELTTSETDLSDSLACVVEQFPFKFSDFDADEPYEGFYRIRMYHAISQSMYGNYLSINFSDIDTETLESCPDPSTLLGQSLSITETGCVRAAIQVNACQKEITARITGTLELEEFEIGRGKRISGKLQGSIKHVERVESTTDTYEKSAPIGEVSGEFSFVNHQGTVWEH